MVEKTHRSRTNTQIRSTRSIVLIMFAFISRESKVRELISHISRRQKHLLEFFMLMNNLHITIFSPITLLCYRSITSRSDFQRIERNAVESLTFQYLVEKGFFFDISQSFFSHTKSDQIHIVYIFRKRANKSDQRYKILICISSSYRLQKAIRQRLYSKTKPNFLEARTIRLHNFQKIRDIF